MSEERKITVTPATRHMMTRRVDTYCCVSTRSQEQMDSLAKQVSLQCSDDGQGCPRGGVV